MVIRGIERGKQVTLDIHRHRVPVARGGGALVVLGARLGNPSSTARAPHTITSLTPFPSWAQLYTYTSKAHPKLRALGFAPVNLDFFACCSVLHIL